MRKFILTLLLVATFLSVGTIQADASLISDRSYRIEQRKVQKQDIKKIKNLFKVHEEYANKHDITSLKPLYADNYVNNDGFTKDTYFHSVKTTWDTCKDLVYDTKILSIDVTGNYAKVNVEETASGTVYENFEDTTLAGEIHSKARGIYHLTKINANWYIMGETSLSDESSLLYGDARFMNMELEAPAQVAAGETYTVTLKVDADDKTFIIGAIDHDPVKYPPSTPKSELRALNQSHTLERLIKANSDNLNEYAVTSMAISKVETTATEEYKIYLAGLACIMKRINVIPVNKFIKIED